MDKDNKEVEKKSENSQIRIEEKSSKRKAEKQNIPKTPKKSAEKTREHPIRKVESENYPVRKGSDIDDQLK